MLFNQNASRASAPPSTLVPKPGLARELGVSSRTISRWIETSSVEFPRPVRIRGRLFFHRDEVVEWTAGRLRVALKGEAK
jgi:predicted DNA-binding transcriptional regulator AlpA